MTDAERSEYLASLSTARQELEAHERATESEMEQASFAFKSLAGQSNTMVHHAAKIVDCIQDRSMYEVLATVRSLSGGLSTVLDEKLEAEISIVAMLRKEASLLGELTDAAHHQQAVASDLRALSVLTNIEVAKLGEIGSGFQILARELSTFSASVSSQTTELTEQTETLKTSIADSGRHMGENLPRLREEMGRAESEIAKTLNVTESALSLMETAPAEFKQFVEEAAQQINGVVVAITSYDITRQQIEHVREALQLIEGMIETAGSAGDDRTATIYAGILVQIGQMQNVQDIVNGWISQIHACMEDIRQLCVSKVFEVGNSILAHERELSSQIATIESLQQRSHEYSERIQDAFSKLSTLLQVVNDHLGRSKIIRQRLRLLTLNSLIEATHLGEMGAVVSEIAYRIKCVSEDWSSITADSQNALTEIVSVVKQAHGLAEACSDNGRENLLANKQQARNALDNVRGTAEVVSREASYMQSITAEMQSHFTEMEAIGRRLSAGFEPILSVLNRLKRIAEAMKASDRGIGERYEMERVRQLFSASYTTEGERVTMQAALDGSSIPLQMEGSFAGNDVELF